MDAQLAHVNVSRMRAPLDDPRMWGFVRRADAVNRQAEAAPGFVWRLPDDEGHSPASIAVFGPDAAVNLSVWESAAALRAFTYAAGMHADALRRRADWFHPAAGPHLALWWPTPSPPPTTPGAACCCSACSASSSPR